MEWVPLYIYGLSSLAIMPMCPLLDVVFSPMEHKKACSVFQSSALSEYTVDAYHHPQHCGAIDLVLKRMNKKKCAEMEEKPGQLNEDPALNFCVREQVESSYNTAFISIMTRVTVVRLGPTPSSY